MSAEKVDVVEYVFGRLSGAYMGAWERSFGGVPISDVKTVWQYELSKFQHNDAAKMQIMWALDNLPERPLNAIAFRNLCRQAPAPAEAPKLPEPRPDPERLAKELAKLVVLKDAKPVVRNGWKDWAHALKAKDELNPRSITPTIRKMYQEALKGSAA